MSDKFKKATGGTFVTLVKDKVMRNGEPSKARYVGSHIVGILLKSEPGKLPKSINHTIHLYSDPTNEDLFGQEPDGEVVILGGSTVINGAFQAHNIGPGAVVEIKYLGTKQGAGGTEYENYDVGFFYPKAQFSKATPAKKDDTDVEEEESADEPFPTKTPEKSKMKAKPVAAKKAPVVVVEHEDETVEEESDEEESDEEELDDLDM